MPAAVEPAKSHNITLPKTQPVQAATGPASASILEDSGIFRRLSEPAKRATCQTPNAAQPSAANPVESNQAVPVLKENTPLEEGESLAAPTKPVGVACQAGRSLRRLWPVLAAVVLLLGLVMSSRAVGVFEFKTKNGVIVSENIPEDAVVEVDGKKVPVSSTAGEPLKIEISPGTHGLLVKRGNEMLLGESVTLESGGQLERSVPAKETAEKQPPAPSSEAVLAPAQRPSAVWTSPSTNMAFVRLEGGEFMIGSSADDTDARDAEKPQHKVRISPLYVGVTEVTQEQYQAVMGNNPSWFSSTGGGKEMVAGRTTGPLPVEQVSWLDAVRFCNSLSRNDGLAAYYDIAGDNVQVPNPKGSGYRLPTEAEWEYACRAGTPTNYSFGDDPSKLGDYALYRDNSGGVTHPVGQKRPSNFGLYDMHGNVWEWCWDWYDDAYYGRSPVDDPPGGAGASHRVIRGETGAARLGNAERRPASSMSRGTAIITWVSASPEACPPG